MSSGWACIARMGGIGDNLIASSVLPGLKAKYGKLEVITSRPQHVVFENNPYIDKLSVRDPGDPNWGDGHSWHEWFNSRSKEYDFFANLSHSCEYLRVFMKAQTQFWWSHEARRKLAGISYLETVHDICGIPHDGIAPNFFSTDEERLRAAETRRKIAPEGGRIVGWVLTGTRIDKIYPWADVAIARIIRELGVSVVLMGAPVKDYELAKAIQKDVFRHNGTLDGLHLALSADADNPNWPVRRIISQAQDCDLVVGPDTGPLWGVAMRSMPKIMLLSHASDENITKHWVNTTTLHADRERVPCWPCHRLHDDAATCVPNEEKNGAACISDISIDLVVTAVRDALGHDTARDKLLSRYGSQVALS